MGLFSDEQPEVATIHGKSFECLVCRHNQFWEREAQLNTALATLFNMDWANQSATCLVCAGCGYIHWFLID
jgi:predicted nucleic-acid-binding Zn-ribbon protein